MFEQKPVMFAKNKTSQELSATIIILVVVLAAYFVELTNSFGIMDDYSFLQNAIVGSNDTFTLLIGAGRPINAVLLDLGFSLTGSIENLTYLRMITLFGIWLLGCGFYFFSRLNGVSYLSALAIACGIILLPSFQVYASWAQHFTTPFSGALALLSAFILTPVCTISQSSRVFKMLLSVLLLIAAILIYQPIAMLFCTGILISIISQFNSRLGWSLSRIVDTVTVFVIAMLIGFVIFKFGQYLYPTGSSRSQLLQNLPGKLRWFVSEPIANVLSLYKVVPTNAVLQFLIFLPILLGALLFIYKHKSKNVFLIFIYGFFCVLGSYAPSLITAENWASYRSIGALSSSMVVLLVLMVSELCGYIKNKYITTAIFDILNKNLWIALTILLIILTMQANYNVLNGFVIPNITELNNLASALNDGKNTKFDKVTVIVRPSSWTDSAAKPIAYDEFGMPSSVRDYYAKTIVDIVLRSTNKIPNAIISMSEYTTSGREKSIDTNSLVIDFPRLVTSQRFKAIRSTSLNFNPKIIVPLNINDENWTNGIFTNQNNPNAYGFVYRSNFGTKVPIAGDKLKFNKSGVRVILRVDVTGDYINVVVDGEPLQPKDGYPHSIVRL
jgi:hypothetical protein